MIRHQCNGLFIVKRFSRAQFTDNSIVKRGHEGNSQTISRVLDILLHLCVKFLSEKKQRDFSVFSIQTISYKVRQQIYLFRDSCKICLILLWFLNAFETLTRGANSCIFLTLDEAFFDFETFRWKEHNLFSYCSIYAEYHAIVRVVIMKNFYGFVDESFS